MTIELIRNEKCVSFESFREAYTFLIDQVIEDKIYETDNVTILRFKAKNEIVQVVQFAPSYSWERILNQIEDLPKLCETVLGNLNAALVFHKAFFKKADTHKTPYMCLALRWAADREIITRDGSELTKAYIELVLNKLAEDTGWIFVTPEFEGDGGQYIKGGCVVIAKEDLALNLLLDEDEKITEEKQIKDWWLVLISRLEENIYPSKNVTVSLRP